MRMNASQRNAAVRSFGLRDIFYPRVKLVQYTPEAELQKKFTNFQFIQFIIFYQLKILE